MRPATLQGGGADQGRVGLLGSLRGQIPGPSREAGTQADGAVGPGRGDDEEGGGRERIETAMKETNGSTLGVSMCGFFITRDLCLNKSVDKTNKKMLMVFRGSTMNHGRTTPRTALQKPVLKTEPEKEEAPGRVQSLLEPFSVSQRPETM